MRAQQEKSRLLSANICTIQTQKHIAKIFFRVFILSMNEISFTGIHNIKIKKQLDKRFGSYLAPNGVLKQGEKHYKNMIVECDLSDDASGKDFAEFVSALKKCGPKYEFNCIQYQNQSGVNHLKLRMDRFDVQDELGRVTEAHFKINNFEIPLNNRETLPLYTFMAALTRKIQELQGLSEDQCKYLKFINSSVHKKAVDFIENIM